MLRHFRRHFGISAPRLTVRTHLGWHWRAVIWTTAIVVVAGMIWWGFDFGRFLAGFDSSAARGESAQLHAEAQELRADNETLRTRTIQLESELQVAKGAQATLSKQTLALQAENTQIKQELVFLHRLMAGSSKDGAPLIQRVQVEREAADTYRYQVLLVSGSTSEAEFSGRLQLQVNLMQGSHRSTITLPNDQPASKLAMALNFKYYQRVEGTFSVPAGSHVKSVQARLFENGKSEPRALHTLNLPS
jgi:hypothetical protein